MHFIFPVKVKDLFGIANSKGEIIVSPQFEEVDPDGFVEGIMGVRKDGNWGYINEVGETIIPYNYDFGYPCKDGYIVVQKDNKYGVIDKKNKVIIPFEFDYIGEYSDGLFPAKKSGIPNFGYIDITGNFVIKPQFFELEAHPFRNGIARVMYINSNDYCFIDKTGKKLFDRCFEDAGDFFLGLAPVMNENGLWGYINTQGKLVIEPKYLEAWNFSNDGLARIKTKNNLYGFIDKFGKEVIKPIYTNATDFLHGFSVVQINNKEGVITTKGNKIIPTIYDEVIIINKYIFKTKKDGKVQYIDYKGNIIFTPPNNK